MQAPMSLKMSATWENEKLSSSIVPRICNLSITQVLFDRLVEEKLDNSRFFFVCVRMRDNNRRVLRSPELAFPSSIPGIVCLNFNCTIQYSHALKRDSSNFLQLLIQRRKKYKKKSVNFGYKTLAYCTIDLAQVLQRKIENKMLDLYEDPKSLSNIIGRIEVQSLSSIPAEKDMFNDRKFYEEEDDGIHDQFSEAEDTDHGEDSDFDQNCTEFGESRQKKIMKAMSVGVGGPTSHRRSSSPSAALPEWQKQIKQKIMGLLKKVKLMEHSEVLDPRHQLWDEIDQFDNASDDSDIGDMDDSVSIQSTPRPVLRPFFGSSGANNAGGIRGNGYFGLGTSEDTLNTDGGAKLLKKLQLEENGSRSSVTYEGEKSKYLDNGDVEEEPVQPTATTSGSKGFLLIKKHSHSQDKGTGENSGGLHSISGVDGAMINTGSGTASGMTAQNHGGIGKTKFKTGTVLSVTLGNSGPNGSTGSASCTVSTTAVGHLNNVINTTSSLPIHQQQHLQQSISTPIVAGISAGPATTTVSGGSAVTVPNTSSYITSTQHQQQGSLTSSAGFTSLANTSTAVPVSTSSSLTSQQKQKKLPMSGIKKTFSLSGSNTVSNNTTPVTVAVSDISATTGVSYTCNAFPDNGSNLLFSPISTGTPSFNSGNSGPIEAMGSVTVDVAHYSMHDTHPRPELIEQINEYLASHSNSNLDIIYLISLSDLGGKYTSDLFQKEQIPHLILASFADTKYAISQIINRIRKRNDIIKVCLLGGDCHLNNVLRVFIDQMNLNYSIDLLCCFRFFIIPITGLYLATAGSTTPFLTSLPVSGSVMSNTMARRLCSTDPKYANLFAEFLKIENCSLESGSERDNKFLFGVQDYLQANNVVNCPIGECLIACKVKQGSVPQDCDSSSESFIPFVAEVRLGEAVTPLIPGITSAAVSASSSSGFTFNYGADGAAATPAGQQQFGPGNKLDSGALDENWLLTSPAGGSSTTSPPRSPVISNTTGVCSENRTSLNLSSSLPKESFSLPIGSGTTISTNNASTSYDYHNIDTSVTSPATTTTMTSSTHQQQSTLSHSAAIMATTTNSTPLCSSTVGGAGGGNNINSPVVTGATIGPLSTGSVTTAVTTTGNTSAPASQDLHLEYWTDHSSKKISIKTSFRQFLVSPLLTDQQHLSLTVLTREKKQKIMRIAKKAKHEVGDMKKETVYDVNRILCTAKGQNSEIKVTIDGVLWSSVKFFQLSPSWRTQIKSFPIATFS